MLHKEMIKKYAEMEEIILNLTNSIHLCHLEGKPFAFNGNWEISYTKKAHLYQVIAKDKSTGEIIIVEGDDFEYPFDTIIKNILDKEIYG